MKQYTSQMGIKIKKPDRFFEEYNSTLDVRYYGKDNLYPQMLRDLYETSPSFSSSAMRKAEFLYGEGTQSTIISNKTLKSLLIDYSIYGGFALFVRYNGLGDIIGVDYVPFETVRLGECGENNIYTYCYVCSDWSGVKTINKKKVDPKKNKQRYFMFTPNLETRLRRIENGEVGEVLYFSNTTSYPTEPIRAVLNYVSSELGTANVIYRDVRSNFMPNSVLAIPKQSDEDFNAFQTALTDLQGDENAYKILALEYSSQEDKPEAINLVGNDYVDRMIKINDECEKKIVSAYQQQAFLRLAEGSLGFGSDAISNIYTFYNIYLKNNRAEIENELKQLDPTFTMNEIKYPVSNTNITTEI